MKKTKNLSLLIMSITTLVLGICSILIPGNQVQAAEEGKADIVLHKKQMLKSPSTQIQNTGDVMDEFEKNYQALENIEFKIYDATAEFYDLRANGNKGKGMTSEEAIRRIQSFELSDLAGREPLETRKTDFEGKLTFRVDKEINGKDAVYLIIESDAPNVVEAANLVVAFPVYQMDSDGNYTDIELDTVHLYPKNVISNSGILKITKRVSYDHKETLDGAKFIVSKSVADKEEGKENQIHTLYISGAKEGIYEWSTDETKAFKFVTGKSYQPGNKQIEEGKAGTGEIVINEIAYGTYTVTEVEAPDNASMINDEVNHKVTITEKEATVNVDVINDKVKVDKSSDKDNQSVQIGQKIQYNIESTIPQGIQDTFPDGTRRYTSYKLIDKHSEELTFVNESTGEFAYELKDGNKVIAPENYTITEDPDKKGFTLEVNADYLTELTPNNHLTFDYFMFLNEKAVPGEDYTNTANVETGDLTDETKPVTVKTGGAMFQKVDQDNKKTGLKNAKFVIQNETKDKYVVIDETTKEVTWTTDKNQATAFTSGENGEFEVTGLEFGTYYLVETEAPDGYVLLKNPIEFTVDENSYNQKQTVEVVNKHKGSLPMTGGIGSIVFVVGGISAFGFAAFYFKKRLSESK